MSQLLYSEGKKGRNRMCRCQYSAICNLLKKDKIGRQCTIGEWIGRDDLDRVRRVGFFNFGSGRVRVLKKYFGSGRVGLGIGYLYQIPSQMGIEILVGYSPSISLISYTF